MLNTHIYDKNKNLLFSSDNITMVRSEIIVNDKEKSKLVLYMFNEIIEDNILVKIFKEKEITIKFTEEDGRKYKIIITNISDISGAINTFEKIYINQNNVNLIKIFGNIEIIPENKNDIFSLEVTIHSKCNMKCDYCFQNKKINLSDEETETYFDKIFNFMSNFNVTDYVIMGGEITAKFENFKLVDSLFRKYNLYNNNVVTKIFTNCMLYNKELSDFILENNKIELWISLDTVIKEHDHRHLNISTIKENLIKYIKDGISPEKIMILSTVTKENIDDMKITVETLHDEIGIINFRFKTENSINEELANTKYENSDFLIKYNSQLEYLIDKYKDSTFFRNSYLSNSFHIMYSYQNQDGDRYQLSDIIISKNYNHNFLNLRSESKLPIKEKIYDCIRETKKRIIDLKEK